jgi:predicted amidohydrolase
VSRTLNIAAAQYQLDELQSQAQYEDKISRWVEEAVAADAKLLVFPEYGAMELAALAGPEVAADLQGAIDAVSERMELQATLHTTLAASHDVTIVAASGPVRHADGSATNVARMFHPSGKVGEYAKLMMTPWERDPGRCAAGPASGLQVFDHRHRESGAGDLLRHRVSAVEPGAGRGRVRRSFWHPRTPRPSTATGGCGQAAWRVHWRTRCTRFTRRR